MKCDDGRGHHRKLCVILGHLVNGGVGALDGELHQIFDVGAVDLVAKASSRTSIAVCDATSPASAPPTPSATAKIERSLVVQKRIFIQRATFVQAAVRTG